MGREDYTDPWMRHVPALFRALADPAARAAMPRPEGRSLEEACASWGALHYALNCLLAWRDIPKGLAWWYRAGKPVVDSDVLALIRDVWGQGDLIDYYAAWAWKPAGPRWLAPLGDGLSEGPSPTELAKNSHWPDEAWWRAFLRRGAVHRHDPFYGGGNPLHLSSHTGWEDSVPSESPVVHLEPSERRGVLITDGLSHWLADLEVLGQTLPPSGNRSWRIEVFDRRIGFLGEYRQSRVTGRWFRGRHGIHEQGC